MTSTSFVGYKEEEEDINFGGTIVVVVVAIDLRQRNFSEGGKRASLCVREEGGRFLRNPQQGSREEQSRKKLRRKRKEE